MKKKRIVFIHHGVGIGGAPQSLLLLIRALDHGLYDPVVLFLFDSPAIDLFRNAGIAIVGPVGRVEFSHTVIWWYRWYHAHHAMRALWDWFMVAFFDANKWFDALKPDIVHLNTSSLSAWAVVAWWKKIPVVWHIRESLAPGYLGIRQSIIRFLVGYFATKIVAISKHDGRFWSGNSKLQILPNPVDCDVFVPSAENRQAFREQQGIPQTAHVLVYLGGLSREKGTLLALQLLGRLLERGHSVYLVVAGSWQMAKSSIVREVLGVQSWYDQVEGLVDRHQENIRFTGVLSSTHELLQASDCLLFPAQKGHFARPVLEAGAVGIPVLASWVPPLDELVVDGETGFLCGPEDVKDWAGRAEALFGREQGSFLFARKHILKLYSLSGYKYAVQGLFCNL